MHEILESLFLYISVFFLFLFRYLNLSDYLKDIKYSSDLFQYLIQGHCFFCPVLKKGSDYRKIIYWLLLSCLHQISFFSVLLHDLKPVQMAFWYYSYSKSWALPILFCLLYKLLFEMGLNQQFMFFKSNENLWHIT